MIFQFKRIADLLALLLLGLLTLLFFWNIVFTNLILVGLDVFTYFYPYRAYAAEALQAGHLPLWNPYLFMGVPFLANLQTAVLYPLNVLLAWLPAPQLVAYSAVLHVFLAGAFTYALARATVGLSRFGSFVAAAIFAFSGFLGAQVEHINQLNAAVWLPMLLLLFDRAREARSIGYTLLTVVAVAVQLLAGHAQTSYIVLFAVGFYAVFPVVLSVGRERTLRSPSLGQGLLWGPGLFVVVVGLGVSLGAVQLIPAFELSRLSVRAGGLSFHRAASFSLDPRLILVSLLPTFGKIELFSEYVAYVGIFGLGLAVVGFLYRRDDRLWRFSTVLVSLGLFLALGGYNPFYWLLYKVVPGFALFRAPARWLLLYTFGVSILAGFGADYLTRLREETSAKLDRHLFKALGGGAAVVLLASPFLRLPPNFVLLLWPSLVVVAVAILWLGLRWHSGLWHLSPRSMLPVGLVFFLLVELFAARRTLAYNSPTVPEAYTALRPPLTHLVAHRDESPLRILSFSQATFDPGDLLEIRRMFGGSLSEEAVRSFVVATKQKEVLAPNLPLRYRLQSVDGYGGGLLPTKRFIDFAGLILPEDQVSPDGRMWERLRQVPAARVLDLLGVKYVVTDKVSDLWWDGVYYDLALPKTLSAEQKLQLSAVPSFPTTGVGAILALPDAPLNFEGTAIEIQLVDRDGRQENLTLAITDRVGDGLYGGRTCFRDPLVPQEVHVSARSAGDSQITLRGMSLLDRRTETFQPLVIDSDFALGHTGNVKVYHRRDAVPRAILVHRARVIPEDDRVLRALRDPGYSPRDEVVLSSGEPLSVEVNGRSEVTVESYDPERVVLEVRAAGAGYLVLTDAFYPGWRAFMDGQSAPVLRANYLFRAVRVPKGEHRVTFAYEPFSLRLGMVLSIATGIGLVVLAVALSFRRLVPDDVPRRDAGKRV